MVVVCERWSGNGDRLLYWPQVLLAIVALLSHLGWVAQPWVTEDPKPFVPRWFSIRHLVSNWLKPSVPWLYYCLTTTCFRCSSAYLLLWPRKGSLMKMQTRILDNRLYYTRKIELHRKGKKSRTVWITPIVIYPSGSEISVLITVRRVHYSKMSKVPTTPLPKPFTS